MIFCSFNNLILPFIKIGETESNRMNSERYPTTDIDKHSAHKLKWHEFCYFLGYLRFVCDVYQIDILGSIGFEEF